MWRCRGRRRRIRQVTIFECAVCAASDDSDSCGITREKSLGWSGRLLI